MLFTNYSWDARCLPACLLQVDLATNFPVLLRFGALNCFCQYDKAILTIKIMLQKKNQSDLFGAFLYLEGLDL